MFYSQDVLAARGQSSLAVVWLAATLGRQSTSKKLGRRELNSVNVVTAWCVCLTQIYMMLDAKRLIVPHSDFLTSPPEPLALRLSSNLMMGVARVYYHQTHFFYSDVSHVFLRLKRAFAVAQTDNIDMPAPVARTELITLEATEMLLLPDRTNFATMHSTDKSFATPSIDRFSGAGSILTSSVGSTGPIALITPAPTPRSPASDKFMDAIRGSDNNRRSTLSLDMSKTPAMRSAGSKHHAYLHDQPPSSGPHTNRSILLSAEPGADRISISNYGTSITGSGIDAPDQLLPTFDGMPDNDFDIFADLHGDAHGHDPFGRETRIDDFDPFATDFTGNLGFDDMHVRTNTKQPDVFMIPDSHEFFSVGQTNGARQTGPQDARVKSTRKRALFDDSISLPDDAFMAYTTNRGAATFSDRSALVSSRSTMHRNEKTFDRRLVADLIASAGIDTMPVSIASFWKTSVVTYFSDNHDARRKRSKQTPIEPYSESDIEFRRGTNDDDGAIADAFDYGDNFDFQVDHGVRGSLGEVGRAANGIEFPASVSPRRMPWHVDSITTGSSASDGRSGTARSSRRTHDRPPSSIGDDFLGIADSVRKSIDGRSSRLEGIQMFDDIQADALATEFDDVAGTATASAVQTERESAAFLAYIKTIAEEADTDTIHFFDIVEHVSSKTAVVQAFFNVLDLATRRSIRVVQSKPYGDIELIPLI